MINESSPLLKETRREQFHSKVAQLLYPAFRTTRVTKATEENDDTLLRVLKYLRGMPDIGLVLDGSEGVALEVFADAR